ncbi:protein-arginine deiminase type-2 isoform X2 [Labeo rohita]|uniref:protein-arginine deiminase type-2 isoform X2 n=1 Tax=Labeo rohita TaxID=84645 RepID=UPI0021E1D466|nr:protein-arginine deiminase type-2 isoform X2 [Labeo rohita]
MDMSQQQKKSVSLPQSLRKRKMMADVTNMSQRTCRLEIKVPTQTVYVVGTEIKVMVDRCAPPLAKSFSVKCTPNVYYKVTPQASGRSAVPYPLTTNSILIVTMDTVSETANDSKLSVRYYGEKTESLGDAVLHLTAVEISLDVDADRDGVIEKNNPNKGSWKWGPKGHGAILLVNCDSETKYSKKVDSEVEEISKVSDLQDMSKMILRTNGPAELPEGYKLTMHISQTASENVRVFRPRTKAKMDNTLKYQLLNLFLKDYMIVVGRGKLTQEVPYLGGKSELELFAEGLRFPDKDFDGLITINLSLTEPSAKGFPESPVFTDRVVFHISPWIMTPNTLKPVEVYVCSTKDNTTFLNSIENLVDRCGYKLKICYEYMNRGDRWIQDEIEFGYIDSPHHRFPVVLDSPRDGDLQEFPYNSILGPDFGYVTRYALNEKVTSLDSFGNLEVSPPVTVNGKNYPLGRIIIGVAFPTATRGRNMTKVVQDFLWAQKVQEPIALYSDWLVVGHVDEFMTFVPAPDRKKFRLLLASPDAGYKIFKSLEKQGYGKEKMFPGLPEAITVNEIVNDTKLQAGNRYVQNCIDWNRDVLKKELGLEEEDIIDLPILFKMIEEKSGTRAVAYYPDMVNMIVLGDQLGIPKPFGPQVNGKCALETEVSSLLEPLGLKCNFIDDFAPYHKLLGEIHCGSNVRREPSPFKWWNVEL